MKKILYILVPVMLLIAGFVSNADAQLTGSFTIPGTPFATIQKAIDSLNKVGVGSGGVTFNCTAGSSETFSYPTAGTLRATGTATDQIIFQTTGGSPNYRITAGVGGAGTADAIIRIVGGDYITFDGIDLIENNSNITTTTAMEWGYALVKKTADTSGCQNITIKNCRIGLRCRIGATYFTSTVGIVSLLNRDTTTTAIGTLTKFSHTASYNKFYGNNIDSAYIGMSFTGYGAASPYSLYDHYNEIGVDAGNNFYRWGGGSSTGYAIYTIYQDSLKVANNLLDGSKIYNHTTTLYGMYLSTGTSSSAWIYNNTVQNLADSSSGSQLCAIGTAMGSTPLGNTVKIYNNTIQNIYRKARGTPPSATTYLLYNTGAPDTLYIYGNIIRNDTLCARYYIAGIYTSGAATVTYIYSNQIYNIKRVRTTSSSSTYYMVGIYYTTSKNYIYSNQIYNISSDNSAIGPNAAIHYGIYTGASPTVQQIYNNEIDSIYNSGTGDVRGIYPYSISSSANEIYGNKIYSLKSDSGSVYGIYHSAGATTNIYKNRIYDLEASNLPTATVYGIYLYSSTLYNVYNNFISDLRAPTSSSNMGVIGIYEYGGNSNVYYNTIYLNASSSNTAFGSAAIYAITSYNLDLRNNIIVNNSTPGNGSFGAKTVAYRRSSNTLTSYLSTSNNNCFYGGNSTTDTAKVLYFDGTVGGYDMTMSAYKSRVSPRDAQSFRELPPFRDITSAPRATPYDLRIDTTVKTSCESGGQTISTPNITDDYFGIPRYPNPGYPNNDSVQYAATAPDIGANEFGGKPQDISGPVISYTPITSSANTAYKDLQNVTLSDPSGVDFNTGTAPRIYYKKTTNSNDIDVDDTTNVTNGWKWSETTDGSSPISVTMYFSRIYGGVSLGDTIQYFVVAQDLMATPNVGINSGTFSSQPASVDLQAAQFPITGTINKYAITSAYTGTIYVGAGQTYTSLTGTGGLFDAINKGTVTGNVNAIITTDLTEDGTVALNQTSEELNYRIRIVPNGDTARLIRGVYAGGLIRFNGADRITIDGSYNGSGKWLTFRNNSTSSASTIYLYNDASDDSVKNCYIQNSSTAPIYIAASTTLGNNNNVFDNLDISDTTGGTSATRPSYGVYVTSGKADGTTIINSKIHNISSYGYYQSSSTYGDSNTVIKNNDIYRFGTYGLDMYYVGGLNNLIEGNRIYQDTANFIGSSNYGIYMYYQSATAVTTIRKNKIYNLAGTSSCNTYGIYDYGAGLSGSTVYIYNNAISVGSTTVTTGTMLGILTYGSATNHTVHIYYNSINIGGSNVTSGTSYGINKNGPTANFYVKNNTVVNERSNSSGTGVHYAYYHNNITQTNYFQNYNNFFVTGTGGVMGYYNTTTYNTLAEWKAGVGKDTNSISDNPIYNNIPTCDLQPQLGTPLLNAGNPVSGITTDIIDTVRNGSTPTIGAWEKDNGIDSKGPLIVFTGLSNTALLTNRTLSADITDATGVDTVSGTRPRIYYKKSSNANTFAGNNQTDDGWKWKEATNTTTPFSLPIDYSLLYPAGTVTGGDTIQYFVVAQDIVTPTPNASYKYGTLTLAPTSVNLGAGNFPMTGSSYYKIMPSYTGNIYVGQGQTYRNLTSSDSGLFQAINTGTVTGNVTAVITSDIWEPGTVALNQTNEELNYNIRIVPDSPVVRTLAGSYAGGLIRLYGADRITFDGSYAGSGQYLKFRNRNTSGYTFYIYYDASNDTLKNIIIQGAYYPVYLGAYNTIGNNYNVLDNVDITDADSAGIRPSYGIYDYGSSYSKMTTIQNSKIHNVSSYGIYVSNSSYTDSGITIRNNDIYRFGTYGIYMYYFSGANNIIEGNRIYQDTANFTGSSNYGIDIYYNSAGTQITVRNNKIYNLCGTSSAALKGMYIYSSSVEDYMYIYNNVISLGNSTATTGQIDGIDYYGYSSNNVFLYYNSIYIGGTQTSSGNSNGIYKHDAANIFMCYDNSIYNARTNSGGSGTHYAYYYSVTDASYFGQNYNDIYADGSGSMLTYYMGNAYNTLAGWQGASGKDTNSINSDPQYTSPTTADLQPYLGSPLKNAGIPISGITTDILDSTRSGSTPTIGAYEKLKNFDPAGPTINYTLLGNSSSTTTRVLTNFATITDPGSGVDTNAGTRPRIYYKKSIDTNTFVGNTNTDVGWKWKEADNNSSPFSFTVDYSYIYGGSVAPGDTINYFVVAQDLYTTPNVSIKSGTFASQPASVNLTSAAFPIGGTINKYIIGTAVPTSIYVGIGETYTSLTGDTGVFRAINGGIIGGNTNIYIKTNTWEPGTYALNETSEELNYTITIQPDAAVNRTLSGSYAGGLIRLNGADRIVFDGRFGGSGNYLTFQNTSTSSSTATFQIISLGTNQGAVNNTIRNCNILTGINTSTTYGIFSGSATIGTGAADNDKLQILYNNISKAYYGLYLYGVSGGEHDSVLVKGNTIGSETVANYVLYYGMYMYYVRSSEISYNEIFNMKGNNSSYGMYLNAGNSYNRYSKNRIHGLDHDNTSSYYKIGMYFASSTSTTQNTIDNNVIYDYRMYGSTSNYYICGIRIVGVSYFNVWYNSISASGAFRNTASGLYSNCFMISSAASNIDMRNNIFSNTMTGTSPYTFTLHSITGTTYTNLNYNDYHYTGGYVGYFNSTAIPDTTTWKANTGETNSKFIDPQFNNVLTNLQPMPGSPILGMGTPVSVTTDILDSNRSGTIPSMGAYEYGNDITGPTINYTNLTNTTSTSSRVLTGFATITDPSGVDTAAGTRPRIYYKKSTDSNSYTGNDSNFSCWKWTEATNNSSPFDFTVDYSLLYPSGTVTQGEVIQYFVVAQDLWSIPRVSIKNGSFASTPSSVNLTTAAFPIGGTINSYNIAYTYAGTVNVGASQTYTTLTGTGGLFEAINNGVVTGNITVNITSNITEPGTVALNQTNEELNYIIRIQPDAATMRTLSGSYAGGLIRLNGADRITFDGSYGGSGRYLTIQNNSTSAGTAAIMLMSTGNGQGCNNDTIKNCIIVGGSTSVTTAYGITIGGATVGSAGSDNDFNVFYNNIIKRAYYGIYAGGNVSPNQNNNLLIKNNEIGSSTAAQYIGKYGIYLTNDSAVTINKNRIFNLIGSISNPTGLYLGTNTTYTDVTQNDIDSVAYTASDGYGARGIDVVTNNSNSYINIVNNIIYYIYADNDNSGLEAYCAFGIAIYGTSGNVNVFYNSVNLFGTNTLANSYISVSAALYTGSSVTNIAVRDNSFTNTFYRNNPGYDGTAYAIYNAGTNTVYNNINYNDYFGGGTQGVLGYLGGNQGNIGAWQTATGRDTSSINSDPKYNSNSNLIPQPSGFSPLISAGQPITGITVDYLDTTRSGSTPTMGAYENGRDLVGPSILYTDLTHTSSTSSRVLTGFATITDELTGVDTAAGTRPRIYYKKSTDSNTFTGNDSTFSCWKWVEASNNSSPFDFTIDYTKLYPSGTVSLGEAIQYFVVAQDNAPYNKNVTANPSSGFVGTSVNNITSAPAPKYYSIVGGSPLSGTYTVGVGAFSKAAGIDLKLEKRTREVTKEIMLPVTLLTEKEKANLNLETKSGSNKTKTTIEDARTKSENTDNTAVHLDDPARHIETPKVLVTRTFTEEYYVFTNKGDEYTGPQYIDFADAKNKSEISSSRNRQNAVSNDNIKGNNNGNKNAQTDDIRGVYLTLAGALADAKTNGVMGAVTFSLVDNTYYGEPWPVQVDSIPGASASNRITIRPESKKNPVFEANVPAELFKFNQAQYIIIEGSNSAKGTNLTFRNTNPAGNVFTFSNGSRNDTIRNCVIQGATSSATSGVIAFTTTNNAYGNMFNAILNNYISSPDTTNFATILIYSAGTATSDSTRNQNNSIEGNHLFNYIAAGVVVDATGNGGYWNISNNNFYQQAFMNTSTTEYGIYIGGGTGCIGNTISGNYIGGQSANCGGAHWTNTAKASIYGLYVSVGTTVRTNIQGNTIQNIRLTDPDTTGLSGGYIYPMYVPAGDLNIGTTTGNTLGHATQDSSIYSAGTGGIRGITIVGTTARATIANNTIANFICTSPAIDSISNYYGIQLYYDCADTVKNNYISHLGENNPSARTNYIPAGIMLRGGGGAAMTQRYVIFNNVIAMGQGFNSEIAHSCIWDYDANNKSTIYYNSMYMGGNATALSTYGYYKMAATTVDFKNNAIYNNRTGGINQYAIYYSNTTNLTTDYNCLYSVTPNAVVYYSGAQTFANYKTLSLQEANSYSGDPAFTSQYNLQPDVTNANSWNLNNKATQYPWITTDINGNPRPTVASGGVPDIGAYEFTPTVNPPIATPSGAPAPSGTTTYSQAGKTLAAVTWGTADDNLRRTEKQGTDNIKNNGGKNTTYSPDVLPTTVNLQYYSGLTPPDTVSIPVALIGKGYWYIDADVDPANKVNYVINWGDQEIGNIADTSKLIMAMYDMKNRVWLPFERGTGDGYSVVNHTAKTITVNGLTRVDSVIFALTSSTQPLKRLKLDITAIIAGFWWDRGSGYNTMKPDTIAAIIRTANPWTVIDTVRIFLDSMGYGYGYSGIANVGTGYFIEINHRNSLSTWSSDSTTGFSRILGTKVFDFTYAQTQAYGSNMIQVGTKWCIINGDVNRDDWIDGSDYLDIFNNYDTGGEFLTPDTNGDDWIDGSDYLIIFNNYDVGATNPITGKLLKPVKKAIQPEIMNKVMKQIMNKTQIDNNNKTR